jgi:hypothetical protein
VSLSLTVSQELEALNQLARQKQGLCRQGSTQRKTGVLAVDKNDCAPGEEACDDGRCRVGVAILVGKPRQ